MSECSADPARGVNSRLEQLRDFVMNHVKGMLEALVSRLPSHIRAYVSEQAAKEEDSRGERVKKEEEREADGGAVDSGASRQDDGEKMQVE